MTWQSDWKGFGCGFLFGSDKIKPLSVLHLFHLFPELSCAWSPLQLSGTIPACHNYRSVHHHRQSPISLSSFQGKWLFWVYLIPGYFAFWKSWCCTHLLSAESCQIAHAQEPWRICRWPSTRDQGPPLAGGSAEMRHSDMWTWWGQVFAEKG